MLYKMTDTTDQYTRKLKYNAFMGTIAVCVIYAIVALAMILYINLTEQGKSLYSDLKPFALTFIFGTLFIIMAVTLMVVYWEPEQATKKEINDVLNNPLSCPDYYTLNNVDPTGSDTEVGRATLVAFSSNIKYNKDYGNSDYNLIGSTTTYQVDLGNYIIDDDNSNIVAKHKCFADLEIYEPTQLNKDKDIFLASAYTNADRGTETNLTANLTENQKKALASFTTMYGGNTSANIIKKTLTGSDYSGYTTPTNADKYDCSKVYPEYLAYLDAKEYIDNNETGPKNLHRCEWAKMCGVPWSSAGCS